MLFLRWFLSCLGALGSLLFAVPYAFSLPPSQSKALEELGRLSLEELMRVDVTTVAGRNQEWFRTPAALTVLTASDLRQAGVRTLLDAMRLVPGMFVSRSQSSFGRANARGFSGAALPAPRNLVLIDGRTVYDPLFGGVFWDVQDVVLEDIERIEVIRGPGATLWGPNAVNGVINIITKRAFDTQGGLLDSGVGTFEQGWATIRYGAKLGERTAGRVYLKYFERDSFDAPAGVDALDDWSMVRGGFRVDADDAVFGADLTLQGDLYGTPTLGAQRRVPVPNAHLQYEVLQGDDEARGGNVLARLTRALGGNESLSMQAYYDRTDRERVGGFEVERDTWDIDARHEFLWGNSHELIWGAGFRSSRDEVAFGRDVAVDSSERTLNLFSAFVQNTSTITEELRLMLGSKLTHYSITDWEAQPSARLSWMPSDQHTFWAAVSRPVRQPSRIEVDGNFILGIVDPGILAGGAPTGQFVEASTRGSGITTDFEHLVAYELGYRARPVEGLTLAVSTYFNDYSQLISAPPGQLGFISNDGEGKSYGVETAVSWRPVNPLRLQATYAHQTTEHDGPILQFEEGTSPRNLASLRGNLRVSERVQLDAVAYYVDHVPLSDTNSYIRTDLGVTYQAAKDVELSLWGHNLFEGDIEEAGSSGFPRGAFVRAIVRF